MGKKKAKRGLGLEKNYSCGEDPDGRGVNDTWGGLEKRKNQILRSGVLSVSKEKSKFRRIVKHDTVR